ncbi:MAG: hypothetical protein Q8Q78_08675 [Hydrogenophaga sp.]|nr:hypothetical protein [Hydrogenophaga sp.]
MKQAVRTFFEGQPYELETQIDEEAEIVVQAWRMKGDLPRQWPAMLGEIVHNLRCALDYLTFQLVILETGSPPTESSKVQFPIFLKREGFNSRGVPTMLKDVGSIAQAIIESVQPFATTNDGIGAFQMLRLLSNWDKHRSIGVVCAYTSSKEVTIEADREDLIAGCGPIVFPSGELQDNTPIGGFKIPSGPGPLMERAARVKAKIDLSLFIAFDTPVAIHNVGALQILEDVSAEVLRVVERINKEVFKL